MQALQWVFGRTEASWQFAADVQLLFEMSHAAVNGHVDHGVMVAMVRPQVWNRTRYVATVSFEDLDLQALSCSLTATQYHG